MGFGEHLFKQKKLICQWLQRRDILCIPISWELMDPKEVDKITLLIQKKNKHESYTRTTKS